MRKRISLAVLLSLLVPLAAMAGTTKLKTIQVNWHTSLGAAYSYSGGDSVLNVRDGSTEASVHAVDTTATIELQRWVMPGPQYGTTVASDSVSWLRGLVVPLPATSPVQAGGTRATQVPGGSAPTVSADSISVQFQVSDDDRNWTSVVWTGAKISPDIAAMGALAVLETGTSNSFPFVIRQVVGGATQSVFNYLGSSAPTANQVYGYRFGRFIIGGDHSGAYEFYLTGFVPADD